MIAKFDRRGTFKKDNYPLRGKYSERRKRKFRGKIILFLRILQLKTHTCKIRRNTHPCDIKIIKLRKSDR